MSWQDGAEDVTPDWQKGAEEVHAPEYQEPKTWSSRIGQGLAKLVDTGAAIPKTLIGGAANAITGKDVLTGQEALDQINPTTFKRAPDYSTMMDRAGVPNPSWSYNFKQPFNAPAPTDPDAIQSIGAPGTIPMTKKGVIAALGELADKAGFLPHNAGQVADMGLNMFNWPGAGRLVGLGGKALTPAEVAIQAADAGTNPAKAVMGMSNAPPSLSSRIVAKLSNSPLINPIAASMRGAGNKVYSSAIDPVLTQGVKAGKEAQDVADTLYNYGIKTAPNMVENAGTQSGKVMDAINGIVENPGFQQPENMRAMLKRAQDYIEPYLASNDPEQVALGKKMQARIDGLINVSEGTPGTPATPAAPEKWTAAPGADGAPNVNYTPAQPEIPGSPAIPPSPSTIADLQKMKQMGYKSTAPSAYNELVKSPAEVELEKLINNGRKEAIEQRLNANSPGLGNKVEQMNAVVGRVSSTKRGQATSEAQYNRNANTATNPTKGLGKLAFALGGMKALALEKGMAAMNSMSMPAGYLTRAAGESRFAPLLDMGARQYILEKNDPNNIDKGDGQ